MVIVLDANSGRELNRFRLEGSVLGLAVSEGHLIANDEKGYIYGFAGDKVSSIDKIELEKAFNPFEKDELSEVYKAAADQIIKETGVRKGYCLVLNNAEGRLAYEIARQSDLKIIGIEADDDKVKRARENLDKTGSPEKKA